MSRWSVMTMAAIVAAATAAQGETTITTSPSAVAGRVQVVTDEASGVTIMAPEPRAVVTGTTQAAPFTVPSAQTAAVPSATATANVSVTPSTGLGVVSTTPDGTAGAGTVGSTPIGTADFEGNGIADNRAMGIRNRDLVFGPLGSTLRTGTTGVLRR